MFDYINSVVKCDNEEELLYIIKEYENNTNAKWYNRINNQIVIDFNVYDYPYCYHSPVVNESGDNYISCIVNNIQHFKEYDKLKKYSYNEYIKMSSGPILTPYDFYI